MTPHISITPSSGSILAPPAYTRADPLGRAALYRQSMRRRLLLVWTVLHNLTVPFAFRVAQMDADWTMRCLMCFVVYVLGTLTVLAVYRMDRRLMKLLQLTSAMLILTGILLIVTIPSYLIVTYRALSANPHSLSIAYVAYIERMEAFQRFVILTNLGHCVQMFLLELNIDALKGRQYNFRRIILHFSRQ